ncbi:MAG: hypothetical protein HKN18_08845 [Silicimonas sp.]|nr:hypothetical protein [Silicimonas sp.]
MADRWEDWFDDSERLLWKGSPAPGVMHWGQNILFTAFGTPFLGAGLVCAYTGLGYVFGMKGFGEIAMGIFLTAFSVPFISVGGAMVFGVWILDRLKASRTRYALTNKAGYVATSFWNRNMDVFPVLDDTRIELIENRNGTSTVYFHFEEKRDSDGDQLTSKKGFSDIGEGHLVYRLIRDLQAGEMPEPIDG